MKATLTEEILDGLAQKLDEFAQVLSPEEQAVLLAIFRLGSNTLNQVGKQTEGESGSLNRRVTTPPMPISALGAGALSQSIKTAFRPALARGLTDINVASSGVEVGVKWGA